MNLCGASETSEGIIGSGRIFFCLWNPPPFLVNCIGDVRTKNAELPTKQPLQRPTTLLNLTLETHIL